MTKIGIIPNEQYVFVTGVEEKTVQGQEIIAFLNHSGPKVSDLKELYVSLSRAIEEGNDLRLGIVVGQVLSKLNEIINEAN
jgi:hypothetical protein